MNFVPYSKISQLSLASNDEYLNNILESNIEIFPRKIDKEVVLYGAGSLGKMARSFFDYINIPISYVIDKNAHQYTQDKNWQSINIISPDKVREADKKNYLLVICIVTAPMIEIREQLLASGWCDVVFFYDVSEAYSDKYPLSNGWFLNKLNENEIRSIKKVYSLWSDDTSKIFYLQFIAWRRLRIEFFSKDVKIITDNRFFIPEVVEVLKKDEVFIDCGAHIGSVTKKIVQLAAGTYNKIYAIEPDIGTFSILKNELCNTSNCELINCALSDTNGFASFYDGFDFASKLNPQGASQAKTVTIDHLKIPATFIKIHLEGGELAALRGSLKTLRQNRPILVVTLYHNMEGAWKIPLLLSECVSEYKIYFRLHSWGGTGAVLYLIPKEREKGAGEK